MKNTLHIPMSEFETVFTGIAFDGGTKFAKSCLFAV